MSRRKSVLEAKPWKFGLHFEPSSLLSLKSLWPWAKGKACWKLSPRNLGYIFTYFELFPFSKYKAMAPQSRVSSYYCELGDRTFVPGANLEEHKVGAIHWGLLEASGKMRRCQLQVFWEDLKVGRCKQKLPAKKTILEALREPVEPSN
jgi:hypothetical protein